MFHSIMCHDNMRNISVYGVNVYTLEIILPGVLIGVYLSDKRFG